MQDEYTDIEELKESTGIFYKYDWRDDRWYCKLNDDVLFSVGSEFVAEHREANGYDSDFVAFADLSRSLIVKQISDHASWFMVRSMMKKLFNLPLDKNPKL